MQKSRFIISLDFELLWGVRDKRTIETYGPNICGVRQVIPELLEIFERYDIQATFATVGFLFAQKKDELISYIPKLKPVYSQTKYSPYENDYLSMIGNSEKEDIYHYGSSLINIIKKLPTQEIASHTFSHYYCLEDASLISFEEDMKAAKAIAAFYGVELKTIVFPRNQYSQEHLEICHNLGFIAYRGNEKSRVYHPRKNEDQNTVIRAARLADAYINLTGHHSFTTIKQHGMINLPASRFLRPYSPRLKWADGFRLQRIKNSMTHAASHRRNYHLWWHPHNFGVNLKENLSFLEDILKHYKRLHEQYGMQSKTMRAIAEEILESHDI